MTQSPRILQTIEAHILELQKLHPAASGDFTDSSAWLALSHVRNSVRIGAERTCRAAARAAGT